MTIDELRILRGLSMTKLCEAAGLGAAITVDPEGVTIRPQEEAK